MYKIDNLNFKNKMVKLTVSKSEPTKSKVVKSTMVLTSHDTLPKPTNLDRLEMTTCWKSGKHPGNDLKISIPGTTSHASIQLPPLQVVTAYLSVEGDLCGQYSVCLEPLPGLKELCSRAMVYAYGDKKLFTNVPRTDLKTFVDGAHHPVLNRGVFIKNKLYRNVHSGKTSQPKFYDKKGNRIHPESIPAGSSIQCKMTLRSYCMNHLYGVTGCLDRENIIVHRLGPERGTRV